MLFEFASAVNAVQCAVDLQQAHGHCNGGQPDDRHIVLRVGVNLGDVMVEGSDLYGDGVNVAARLEALAEPGGIFVSPVPPHDHIKNKVKVGFEDLGRANLKEHRRTGARLSCHGHADRRRRPRRKHAIDRNLDRRAALHQHVGRS